MTNMRQLCLSKYTVVLQGKEWCSSVPPSSKQASTLLENNESVVSWLSPKEKNTETEHQIPAILFQGAYWTLSLRMSKSIYRHVRLSQDFQNVQRLHGVQTLRIPRHLLREKQRTQARFEVRAVQENAGSAFSQRSGKFLTRTCVYQCERVGFFASRFTPGVSCKTRRQWRIRVYDSPFCLNFTPDLTELQTLRKPATKLAPEYMHVRRCSIFT